MKSTSEHAYPFYYNKENLLPSPAALDAAKLLALDIKGVGYTALLEVFPMGDDMTLSHHEADWVLVHIPLASLATINKAHQLEKSSSSVGRISLSMMDVETTYLTDDGKEYDDIPMSWTTQLSCAEGSLRLIHAGKHVELEVCTEKFAVPDSFMGLAIAELAEKHQTTAKSIEHIVEQGIPFQTSGQIENVLFRIPEELVPLAEKEGVLLVNRSHITTCPPPRVTASHAPLIDGLKTELFFNLLDRSLEVDTEAFAELFDEALSLTEHVRHDIDSSINEASDIVGADLFSDMGLR